MRILNGYFVFVALSCLATHIGFVLRHSYSSVDSNSVVGDHLEEFKTVEAVSYAETGLEAEAKRRGTAHEGDFKRIEAVEVQPKDDINSEKSIEDAKQEETEPEASEGDFQRTQAAKPQPPTDTEMSTEDSRKAKQKEVSDKGSSKQEGKAMTIQKNTGNTSSRTPEDQNELSDGGDTLNYLRFSLDLQEDEKLLENFLNNCKKQDAQHARDSQIFHRFEWRNNPDCRALGQHPKIQQAARRVLKIPEDAPLYLFGINTLKRKHGNHHRLHTDMEFTNPACTHPQHAGATIWLLLKRSCQSPSPLTLLSGSQKLNRTANDFLNERNCWAKARASMPCNTTRLLKEQAKEDDRLEVVRGPNHEGGAIAWPTTAWHKTDDVCERIAVTIQYASTLECAHSLYHAFPKEEKGAVSQFPDKAPFLKLGGSKEEDPITTTEASALDLFINGRQMLNASRTCISKPPLSKALWGKAQPLGKMLYVSGPFVPNGRTMKHIGRSLKTQTHGKFNRYLKTNQYTVWAGRTIYEASKKYNLAHPPHMETSLEICAVLNGKINYAMTGDSSCEDPFDVTTVRKNQVALLFPTIPHTAMPDFHEDGEHICFKIFPHVPYNAGKRNNYLEASRLAFRSLDVDLDTFEERSLEIFYTNKIINRLKGAESGPKKLLLPGFDRLHVKLTHYQPGEVKKAHADPYDLIVLVMDGSPLEIHTPQGNGTVGLHEFAVIPGGLAHGFASKEGSRVLFIETLNERKWTPEMLF